MIGMTDIEYLMAVNEIQLLKSRRDRAVDTRTGHFTVRYTPIIMCRIMTAMNGGNRLT